VTDTLHMTGAFPVISRLEGISELQDRALTSLSTLNRRRSLRVVIWNGWISCAASLVARW